MITKPFLVYYEPEEIQRNVWYWRRRSAGHLDGADLNAEEEKACHFGEQTVARADRAFQAIYGRPPEPREWTTLYLLLLRNLERDPSYYDYLLSADGHGAVRPQYSPHSAPLRRDVRSRHRSSQVLPVVLIGTVLLGAVSIAAVGMGADFPILPTMGLLGIGFLGLALAAPLMRDAVDVVYVCPECGCEYDNGRIERCRRCYLEFADATSPWTQSHWSSLRPRAS